MIDKRNELFTRLKTAVCAEYPGANVEAEYVNEPSSFPHVSMEVLDMEPMYTDNTPHEKYTRIVLEISVYSNKRSGALSEAFRIADIVSNEMLLCNMVRIYGPRVLANLANNSIKRLVLRFEGTADENCFYRR